VITLIYIVVTSLEALDVPHWCIIRGCTQSGGVYWYKSW